MSPVFRTKCSNIPTHVLIGVRRKALFVFFYAVRRKALWIIFVCCVAVCFPVIPAVALDGLSLTGLIHLVSVMEDEIFPNASLGKIVH